MNILIINTLYYPYTVGGAEVSVQLLAEALAANSHQVTVITLHETKKIETTVINGVVLYRIPLRNIYWPFTNNKASRINRLIWHTIDTYNYMAKRDLSSIIRKIKPDVIHTNNLSGFSVAAWSAARKLQTPIVHTSRDYYLLHPNGTLNKNSNITKFEFYSIKLFLRIKKSKSQLVDKYVGISEHISKIHLDAGFFKKSSHSTIFNSIDNKTARPINNQNNSTKKIIGYIGRIEETKGIEIALKMINLLGSEYTLIIAGTGDAKYVNQLKKSFEANNVVWLGHVSRDDFFHRINILIVPSLWPEPLGRVVLEAYSYGIPVVAANTGGLPEIIEPGITGYCYDKLDPEEAKTKVIKSFELEEKPNINCINASKKFHPDIIRNKYEVIYEEAKSRKLSNHTSSKYD